MICVLHVGLLRSLAQCGFKGMLSASTKNRDSHSISDMPIVNLTEENTQVPETIERKEIGLHPETTQELRVNG